MSGIGRGLESLEVPKEGLDMSLRALGWASGTARISEIFSSLNDSVISHCSFGNAGEHIPKVFKGLGRLQHRWGFFCLSLKQNKTSHKRFPSAADAPGAGGEAVFGLCR